MDETPNKNNQLNFSDRCWPAFTWEFNCTWIPL